MKTRKLQCLAAANLAPTIGLVGPTGSGKSTVLSFLVSPEDNKLLTYNIGESNQTTRISFKVSLNSSMEKGRVILKAKKAKISKDYFRNIVDTLCELIYNLIDEGDKIGELNIDEEVLEKMFNPKNKEYKAYTYLSSEYKEKVGRLVDYIKELSVIAWDDLESLCKARFKEKKDNNGKKRKKQDVYEEVISEEIYKALEDNTNLKESIEVWIQEFESSILKFFDKFFVDKEDRIIDTDVNDSNLKAFIEAVFADDSVFSLVFSELVYVTRPAEGIVKYYESAYTALETEDKPLTINILDTMGISHLSDEKNALEDALDGVLTSTIDGMLFICKADEKDTVYENILEILEKKSNGKDGRLAKKPVTIARTKADVIIKSKAINEYRRETGENIIPNEAYNKYYLEAFESFKKDYMKLPKKLIGDENLKIEFLSLAPNETKELKIVLEQEISEEKLYKIILDLNERIQKYYSEKGQIVAVAKDEQEITCDMLVKSAYKNIEELSKTLVEKNLVHKNGQYLKYLSGYYHGRSISTWYGKHRKGVGHRSDSGTCENFAIFIKNMICNWLKSTDIFEGKFLHELELSKIDVDEADLKERIEKYFTDKRWYLLDDLAFQLSYKYMEEEFENCHRYLDWRPGFRKNLEFFDKKFSDEKYWAQSISDWILKKTEKAVSQILYIKK